MRLNVMTPKRLKLAALVLFILALLFVWMGLGSQNQRQAPQANSYSPQSKVTEYTVWKASKDIQAGQKLTPDDVEAISVTQVSAKQIQDLGAVLSLRVKRPIIAGTFVTHDMLEAARPIADELPVGYRALAVQANEVLTVGGHLQPGDKVDVIYLLRPNAESGNATTVRRLASNIEILAVGSQVSNLNPDEPVTVDPKQSKKDKQQGSNARSVVLAVEEKLAPTILLAESSGDLRLSMVGQDEIIQGQMALVDDEQSLINEEQSVTNEVDQDGNRLISQADQAAQAPTPSKTAHLVKAEGLAKDEAEPDNYLTSLEQFKTDSQPKKSTSKTKTTKSPRGHYIEVIQGDKRAWINSGK